MEIIFRPLRVWDGPPTSGKRAQFKASYSETLALLDYELGRLNARNIVIEAAFDERDIRLDGRPRVDARPRLPGVVLSFDSKHGPLRYPCGTFPDWQDNVRAIALSLEHLRAVDRYGVTRRGEQYTGWKALPAPGSYAMTHEQAIAFLKPFAEGADGPRDAYRKAALKLHPDRGGDAEQFKRLQAAKVVLGL